MAPSKLNAILKYTQQENYLLITSLNITYNPMSTGTNGSYNAA